MTTQRWPVARLDTITRANVERVQEDRARLAEKPLEAEALAAEITGRQPEDRHIRRCYRLMAPKA